MNTKTYRKASRAAFKALEALYASLPELKCKGECQAFCCNVQEALTDLELERIRAALGDEIYSLPTMAECQSCPLLTKAGLCSVYDVRPLICRLFGMVDDRLMKCPHGCKPSRWLTNKETRELVNKAREISDRYLRETGQIV